MYLHSYNFSKLNFGEEYVFDSEGPKGIFRIKVDFVCSSKRNICELRYGVLDLENKNIDQNFVIQNGDGEIIINTVFNITCDYAIHNPNSLIRFSGSTKSRTRLFTMWISKNIDIVQKKFTIYGYTNRDLWKPFKINKYYNSIALKN